jgi:DNA ligase (NAD+)
MDILELRNKIEDANLAYRSGNPIMSDNEYDTLVDTLFKIDPNDDFFTNIGHEVNDRKIKLPIEMASMNKVKTLDELLNWARLKSINTSEIVVITPKYDGLSLGVNDFNGNAFTRGDGETGQESSEHFKFTGDVHILLVILLLVISYIPNFVTVVMSPNGTSAMVSLYIPPIPENAIVLDAPVFTAALSCPTSTSDEAVFSFIITSEACSNSPSRQGSIWKMSPEPDRTALKLDVPKLIALRLNIDEPDTIIV